MIREQIAAVISKDAMKSQETMRTEWTAFVNEQNFGDGPNQPDRTKLINSLVDQEWEEIQPKRVRALAKADKVLALLSPTPSNDTLQGRGEVERLREALTAEDEYWASSRTLAAAFARIRPQAQAAFDAASMRRELARAALQKDTRHDG